MSMQLKDHQQHLVAAVVVVFLALVGSCYLNFYMSVATFAYLLMCAGLWFRYETKLHAALMGAAIFSDISLVLILEFQRDAIATAASFTLSPLQQGHILVSTLAVLLYFPTVYLGQLGLRKGWKSPQQRQWHVRLALAAFSLRTAGFILMFSLLSRN